MATDFNDRPMPIAAALGFLLWLLMLSASLVETDAYRFAAIFVAIYGIWIYYRIAPRPAPSFMAWYCLAWSVYVLVRFAYGYFGSPNLEHGSSEWLYAFPMFFGGIGIGLTRMRFYIEQVLLAFFVLAALFLAASQHWWVIASGNPVIPLYHNNQIHGAVACGLIMIGAFYWFLHYAARGIRSSPYGLAAAALTPVIVLLCLISILGSQSKGVWLALLGTVPVAAILILATERRAAIRFAVAALVLLVAGWAFLFRERLWLRAGSTVEATLGLVRDYSASQSLSAFLQQKIASGTIPESMNARLELWYNACELIRQAPWFGHGNFWIERWEQTRYADVGYYLMHNGYLEILIRHGIVGFLALAFMLAALVGMTWRGYRKGFVAPAAMQAYLMLLLFFALTLLSNSNNRLAIGESLAMLTGGVAFYAQAMERYTAALAARAGKEA
ncbi:O-antigen ligase family protein [Gellertiella hungarica]|uniref:O-antigen ligase n=1 Tax=Gellertiella hungarica TaxID=1572859 RepID=A0A7W6J5P3_9HYPH|nr:O-antigen ligase family protein [Gellertiella hungarica]MBB4064472.1 O-antigen ligase [Gellertiella hungarica]